jgi:hypothetical protein
VWCVDVDAHVVGESAPMAPMTRSGCLIDLSSVPAHLRTAGRRWRWSRTVSIALLHSSGVSQRFLAHVFDPRVRSRDGRGLFPPMSGRSVGAVSPR